ncbi:MAG: hypothetical protein WDO68_17020 [Gammaproteobacteria bacterium]
MDPIVNYAQLGKYIDSLLSANNQLPVGPPHRGFWNTLGYDDFVNGNVPNVRDPATHQPMKILVVGDSKSSNLIHALRGTPGTAFDPDTGAFGMMPANGPPFFTPEQIAPVAAWIDAGCPNQPVAQTAASPYTRERGMNFWFDFDQQTLWSRIPELQAAFGEIFSKIPGPALTNIVDLFRGTVSAGTYPQAFADTVKTAANGFLKCAEIQLRVIDQHFPGDRDSVRLAFEDFGQGVLYDPRRAANPMYRTHIIHMMDGSPSDWVGFHRWHAFIRAQIACGAPSDRWLHLLRCVALAWSIQTEADPKVDQPGNAGLSPARLAAHRAFWDRATEDDIDSAFFQNHFQAPRIADSGGVMAFAAGGAELVGFETVRKLLDSAVAGGEPFHDDKGRFWELPLDALLAIKAIYGVRPIAEAGPNRGARSGIILALKGQPPFGPGGMPRMPLNRTPMADNDIAVIEKWIDDGCPP